MLSHPLAILTAACILGLSSLAWTQTIELIEGEPIEGRIVEVSEDHLIVQPEEGTEPRRLDLYDLARVVWAGQLPGGGMPVGHWRFDVKEGSQLTDDTRHEHHGTLRGARWYAGPNGQGGALRFDGRGDWADLPGGMGGSGQGTISLWFNSSYRHRDGAMLFYGAAAPGKGFGEKELHLGLDPAGKLTFYAWADSEEQAVTLTAPERTADGQWHHVAATWSQDGQITLYVDGQAVAQGESRAAPFTFNVARLASSGTDRVRQFNGIMDDVRLFSYALAPKEIERLAQAPAAPPEAQAQPQTLAEQPWRLDLHGASQLTGEVQGWSEDGLRFTLTLDEEQTADLAIPSEAVTAIWHASPEQIEQARAQLEGRPEQDVAFVLKGDGTLSSVAGEAVGLDGEALTFIYQGEQRKIAADRLVGVVRGGQARDPLAAAFHQRLALPRAGEIAGYWRGVTEDGRGVTFETAWGQTLTLPADQLAAIRFVNGRLIHLTDMQPDEVEQTPYFDRMIPWRLNQSLAGQPLRLSDGPAARGFAVHSRTVLHFDIAGEFDRLRTKVGFQHPEGELGEAALRVLGDGEVLWESLDARGGQAPQEVDVTITGVERLSLEVDFGPGQDVADRVVWAEPQLIREK